MGAFSFLRRTSLLLTLILFIGVSSSASNSFSDLVNEICNKTRNPDYCFQQIGSTDDPKPSDLRDLGDRAVQHAELVNVYAYDEAHVLRIRSVMKNDTVLAKRAETCVRVLFISRLDVKEYSKRMSNKLDWGLTALAADALRLAGKCDSEFLEPPNEPDELKNMSKAYQDSCSILLVIAQKLEGGAKK